MISPMSTVGQEGAMDIDELDIPARRQKSLTITDEAQISEVSEGQADTRQLYENVSNEAQIVFQVKLILLKTGSGGDQRICLAGLLTFTFNICIVAFVDLGISRRRA